MKVNEAIAQVMTHVRGVGKKDFNDHQKFSFRGIDAVVNAVGPALREAGVVVVPNVASADYETVTTTTGKPSTACRIIVNYVFYGPEGDTISCSVAAEAWDSGDKATSKAMSVAFRTALLQALTLPTDEPDPDHSTYERAAARPVDDGFETLLAKADALGLVKVEEVYAYAGQSPEHRAATVVRLRNMLDGDPQGATGNPLSDAKRTTGTRATPKGNAPQNATQEGAS